MSAYSNHTPRILGRTVALLLVIAAVIPLTACADSPGPRQGVVVTTNILGDITREVVGDEAEVTVLMKPNADPHSFGVTARQAAAIEQAGLVVFNGLGLEEGVLRNVAAAEEASVPTLAVGEQVNPIRYTAGETTGKPDPHFWTDPLRMRIAVDVLAEQLISHVEGVDHSVIRQNAARYGSAIEELDTEMNRRFGEIPRHRRKLVTNHHVFGYLARRFDFRVIGALIPSGTTLASPSAADLKSLADTVRSADVPAVFADSSQPDRLALVLAEQAGLDVEVISLFSESLTQPGQGAATYLDMMRTNTDAITEGLAHR